MVIIITASRGLDAELVYVMLYVTLSGSHRTLLLISSVVIITAVHLVTQYIAARTNQMSESQEEYSRRLARERQQQYRVRQNVPGIQCCQKLKFYIQVVALTDFVITLSVKTFEFIRMTIKKYFCCDFLPGSLDDIFLT